MSRQLNATPLAWTAPSRPRLSLLFRPGQRPSATEVVRLSQQRPQPSTRPARSHGFAVSHCPDQAAGWIELLAGGLMYDLTGLSPSSAAPAPEMAHFYGIPDQSAVAAAEAITLVPGEHLREADTALPVVRAMMGLAAGLAGLRGVIAVVWHPARCAMAPAPFAATTGSWLDGGPFPALGLTALFCGPGNLICSEGLAFFIGQELCIEPFAGKNTTYYVKIATRLINQLIGFDPIHQSIDFLGPDGENLTVAPSGSDGLLRVWRN